MPFKLSSSLCRTLLILVFVPFVHPEVPTYPDMPEVITLGGLFPLDPVVNSAGPQREAACRLAVEFVNNSTLLSPVVLEWLPKDTSGTSVGGLLASLSILQENVTNFMGFVGEGGSSVSQTVQTVAAAFDKCQISYSSTSSQLSIKLTYPTFARTVASDAFQAQAAVKFLLELGWRQVGALYTKDTYGIDGFSVFSEGCQDAEIQIPIIESYAASTAYTDYSDIIRRIQSSNIKIIYCHMNVQFAKPFLKQAANIVFGPTTGFVWIFSDGTAQSSLWTTVVNETSVVDVELVNVAKGSIGLNPLGGNGPLYDDFLRLWLSSDPAIYYGANNTPNLYVPYAYDVILTYAYTFQRLLLEKKLFTNISGRALWNHVTNTNFTGLTGFVRFDQNGDRKENFKFLNLQVSGTTPSWVNLGVYDIDTGSVSIASTPIWPDGTTNTPSDGIVKRQIFLAFELKAAFVVIAVILMAATTTFMVITIVYSDHPRIKAATFSFLILILVSGLIAYSCVIILYIEPVTEFTCVAPLWFGHTAFVLGFSCLFTKTMRVWYIFSSAKKITTKKIVIKDVELLYIVGLFCVVLWIYLAIWTVVDRPKPATVFYQNDPYSTLIKCDSSHAAWYSSLYIFEFLMLLIGVFLSFKTRKIELLQFNESSSIAVCIYVLVFLGFIFVPMAYFLALEPNILFLLQCGGIVVATTTVIAALYVPKFRKIWRTGGSSSAVTDESSKQAVSAVGQ